MPSDPVVSHFLLPPPFPSHVTLHALEMPNEQIFDPDTLPLLHLNFPSETTIDSSRISFAGAQYGFEFDLSGPRMPLSFVVDVEIGVEVVEKEGGRVVGIAELVLSHRWILVLCRTSYNSLSF